MYQTGKMDKHGLFGSGMDKECSTLSSWLASPASNFATDSLVLHSGHDVKVHCKIIWFLFWDCTCPFGLPIFTHSTKWLRCHEWHGWQQLGFAFRTRSLFFLFGRWWFFPGYSDSLGIESRKTDQLHINCCQFQLVTFSGWGIYHKSKQNPNYTIK